MDHPEIERFSHLMDREMSNNAHKGDWREFLYVPEIMYEIEYHKAKLIIALRDGDQKGIQEYTADIGNFLVMLLNATNTLNI